MRPVLEILAVTGGGFGILVDRYDDCLNVVVAPPFSNGDITGLSQSIEEGRIIFGVGVVPFWNLAAHHQFLPPITLPAVGPGSDFLSLSRSAHRPSILVCILARRSSAEAVEIPAR
jgi:hypothetical protein